MFKQNGIIVKRFCLEVPANKTVLGILMNRMEVDDELERNATEHIGGLEKVKPGGGTLKVSLVLRSGSILFDCPISKRPISGCPPEEKFRGGRNTGAII